MLALNRNFPDPQEEGGVFKSRGGRRRRCGVQEDQHSPGGPTSHTPPPPLCSSPTDSRISYQPPVKPAWHLPRRPPLLFPQKTKPLLTLSPTVGETLLNGGDTGEEAGARACHGGHVRRHHVSAGASQMHSVKHVCLLKSMYCLSQKKDVPLRSLPSTLDTLSACKRPIRTREPSPLLIPCPRT